MYASNIRLIISIWLWAIIGNTIALKCVEETACSCQLSDGDFYDLSKLSAEGPLNSDSKEDYRFSFQPCKNVKMEMDISPFPITNVTSLSECNTGAGVSLCAQHLAETPISLGTTNEAKWNLLDKTAELVLTHGSHSTRITLNCAYGIKSSTLQLDEKPGPTGFHLSLSSPHACKIKGAHKGLSMGSVLVILLFVFSGVYLIVGALVLKFFRGAIGWELIPNYDFWSEVPSLFRDGVTYTFSGCSANTYDRI